MTEDQKRLAAQPKQYHWYNFCFLNGGTWGSMAYGVKEKDKITKSIISKAKAEMGLPEQSVMISCSYLGFMTEKEHERNDDT